MLDLSKNAEIDKALKEFEAKNMEEAAQNAPIVSKNSERLGLVGWAMKHSGGLIKDERQMEYILLGFVVAAIAVSLFLVFGGKSENIPPQIMIDTVPPNI